MSLKNRDNHNRWRNKTVAFRVSPEEDRQIETIFGGVIGYAMGRFSVWLINRINLSNSSLYSILLLSLVFITFTITDL